MIIIIHGDDITNSRKSFLLEKETRTNPVSFDGEKLEITDLAQAIDGGGLFIEAIDIFIENFISKRKPGKAKEAIISYLNKNISVNIFLWEEKPLFKKQTDIFKKAMVKEHKLPQTLFTFLDSIVPNNNEHLIQLFHQAIENADAEFVFYMLTRHVRMLLALSDKNAKETIDEVSRLASWQKGKLIKQERLFSQEKLSIMLFNLYTIDNELKTGASVLSLAQSIDLFLLSDV